MAGHRTSITLQRIEPKKRGLDALTSTRINLRSIQDALQSELDDQKFSSVSSSSSFRKRDHPQDSSAGQLNCMKTMLQILSLEDSCSLLSREVDLRALASITDENERKDNEDAPHNSVCLKMTPEEATSRADTNIPGFVSPVSQICISAIRNSWKWIARLSKCIGIHLENSANYHQFFAEFSENEKWMRQDLDRILRIYETHESRGDYSDAVRLLEELQEVGVALKQWRSKVDRMWISAQTLVPLDLRTTDIHEATPARAICDYATNEIEFAEDEDLLLLDTHRDNPTRWRLSNGRGQTGEAPSVIILLPGTDAKAIHATVQLRLGLLAEWTDILKTSGRHLMAFLLNVFKAEYADHEMEAMKTMPEADKMELLRLLASIEDLLRCVWSEHSDFIILHRRIALLQMMLQDQRPLPLLRRQPRGDSALAQSLVVQTGALQRLLDAFQRIVVLPLRDLWESWNVIRISPQVNGHPEIQELIEKWERQQTANRVYFASFWRSETPIYEMERTLADLYRFQIAGIIIQSPDANGLQTTYAPTHSTESSELNTGRLTLPSPDSAFLESGLEDDGSDLGFGTETRTAQTEQYLLIESVESKKFVIRSVIHPQTSQEISLQEAVDLGVIHHADGTYRNAATGEAKPIVTAMKEGQIKVMFTTTKRSKEKKSSVGVVTVKTIREETRPHRVQSVLDMRTRKEMTREEAVERDVIDEGHGTYLNRQTGRKMLIAEAVELGLVNVEYSGEVSSPSPDVTSSTYAVHGVLDRSRQKVVPFHDALQRGIVDKEMGMYCDTLTGQRMSISDAILQGYMKARLVEDAVDIENVFTVDHTEVVVKPRADQ